MEMEPNGPQGSRGDSRIWLVRGFGVFLLGGAILAVAAAGGSLAVSAGVMTGFAAYVFLSERLARLLTVAQEKRLRMSLLVHNMELESMAMQDDLTQLFNRRYFFERRSESLSRRGRSTGLSR
jgi:PleD family two-component response regulator